MPDGNEERRRLRWDACLNVRDIGGYDALNGRETRWGRVIRADDPVRLSEAGRTALLDYPIRTMIDLRAEGELEADPPPFREYDSHGGQLEYRHIPFFTDDERRIAPFPQMETIGHEYVEMLRKYRRGVAEVMRAIAHAPEGTVLIHCHGGRDRTGIVVALLLSLAGVPDETIAEDYALSSGYLRPDTLAWIDGASTPEERARREREVQRGETTPEVMLHLLAGLREEWGGAEGYLRAIGVTGEEIDALRRRMLE